MALFGLFKKEKINIGGIDFPLFNGKKRWSYSKNTSKYLRKDYYYKYEPEKLSNYLLLISSYGFSQMNSIRFNKDNGYIIVENLNGRLHIAFHVNK